MTGISDIGKFINVPFKIANSYLKELSNIENKKLNKNERNNHFIGAGPNMIGKKIKEKLVTE